MEHLQTVTAHTVQKYVRTWLWMCVLNSSARQTLTRLGCVWFVQQFVQQLVCAAVAPHNHYSFLVGSKPHTAPSTCTPNTLPSTNTLFCCVQIVASKGYLEGVERIPNLGADHNISDMGEMSTYNHAEEHLLVHRMTHQLSSALQSALDVLYAA